MRQPSFVLEVADSALEFLSTCKLANLTVKAEPGCCLLHRSGRAHNRWVCASVRDESPRLPFGPHCQYGKCANCVVFIDEVLKDGVSVSRTQIEGGAKAVSTSGGLTLQRVRVIYARMSTLVFWFDMEQQ
ncbi:hypothetical protein ABKV19_020326 [Rosa sericea]